MAQHGETRALDPAIGLRDVSEHRMKDAGGKLEALRINRTAGLHVDETQSERVVSGRGRAPRGQGENLEAGCVPIGGAVEMDADEDGVAGLIGDVGAKLEWKKNVVFPSQDNP